MYQKFMSISAAAVFALGVFGPLTWANAQSSDAAVSAALQNVTSWVNQSGSRMTISVSGAGVVTGTYVNNAAGTSCRGTPYAITGWVLNDFISFTVRWDNSFENCNSITGWTGYAGVSGGTVSITTDWNLVYQSTTGPMIQAGNDVFTPASKAMSLSFNSE